MGFDDRSSGISEVFGVMLMLTVTLIIACMVAAFACGQSFDSGKDTISANLVASKLVVDDGIPSAYIIFDHLSGDPVDLNNTDIFLSDRSSASSKTSVSNRDTPTGKDKSGDQLTRYIINYGDKDDTKISVGDRFLLYADDVGPDGEVIWGKEGAEGTFTVTKGDYIEYRIIDRRSGRAISAGSIPVPGS